MGKTVSERTLMQPDIPNPGFSASGARSSGAWQIIIGVLCVIFQIAATGIGATMGDIGAGIWAGIFFMITGAIGMGSKNSSTCSIVMYMMFSFLAFLCSISVVVLSSLGANDDRNDISVYCNGIYFEGPYFDWNSKCHMAESKVAMNAMLILFTIVNVFVTIYAQVICCRGVCCCAPSYATVIERDGKYGTSMIRQEVPVAVQGAYQQQRIQPAAGQVVVLVPSQDNPGQFTAVPYTGQVGQMPPVYGTTPPPGYSYDQETAVHRAE